MQLRFPAVVLGVSAVLTSGLYAQTQPGNPTQQRTTSDGDRVPVFRVTVVARTTPAINYRHRGGSTTIDFRGTPLLPKARGEAKVEGKQGYTEIEVEFDDLVPATRFGPEFLTYVMWAITPEGRAANLGEVLLNEDQSKLNVTTELQTFGLVVTAEPYFAVSQPSDVVVMENVVRADTRGNVEQIEAKYELLSRGTYLMNTDPKQISPRSDRKAPLDLQEARNALQLSALAGADRYASDTYAKAARLLRQAEQAREHDDGRRAIAMPARQATQTAEDARLIAIQRQDEERLARAQQAAADREAEAVARARADAQNALTAAERARADAERARADAERTKLEAEQARIEADRARQRLAEQRAAADASAADARRAAERAEAEKAELRERLQRQLNIILETQETARGLIVNVSDVLFDTGQHTLKPGAREKLARVAGILLAYPELSLEVDGHTDSVGDDDYNLALSERRAEAVRGYLVLQGIPAATIVARAYGEAEPVASNEVAAGRQQNRRVEVVVSGESIGRPAANMSGLRRE